MTRVEKNGSELKFFVLPFQEFGETKIKNCDKLEPSKNVRSFLDTASYTGFKNLLEAMIIVRDKFS